MPPAPLSSNEVSGALTVEQAQHHLSNDIPVADDGQLPEGWVRNVVKVTVASRLSGTACLEYITTRWRNFLPFAQRADRFYFVSSPHWHEVVEAEYQARLVS